VISTRIQIDPRYAETDQSGFVAPARYLPWFEMGRAALLKEHGFEYRRLEADGFFAQVLELGLTVHEPACYADSLTVVTTLSTRPSFRIRLDYEVWRADVLLVKGFTVQVFVSREQRPVRPPADFMAKVNSIFPRPSGGATQIQNSTAGP